MNISELLNFFSKKLPLLFLVSLLMVILPFLILSFYCQPSADDFGISGDAMQMSAIDYVKMCYNEWNGRYFSAFLLSFNPLVFQWFFGYKIIPVVLFIFTFLSYHFFIKTITKDSITKQQQFIASFTLTALYVFNMPHVAMGFYWMTGSLTYQLADIFALLVISISIRLTKISYSFKKILLFLLAVFLITVTVGSNEVIMSTIVILAFSFMLLSWKTKHKWLSLFLFCCVILSAFFVISATGNNIRSEYFPNRHNLNYSILYSIAQTVRFFYRWTLNIPFLLITLLFIPIAYKLSSQIKWVNIHPLIAFLFLVGIAFVNFFTVYWSMGMLAQHRTVNSTYFFFLIGWFLTIQLLINFLKNKHAVVIHELPTYFKIICVLLISVSLLTTANTKTAYLDLIFKRAYGYNKEMNERFEEIEKCRKEKKKSCIVNNLENTPQTIYFIDITIYPNYWINRCYSNYFRIDSICIKKDRQ